MSHLLFVYGSLRRGFHHPAYQYISHYFHFLGDARVKGVLYDMGEYPAAIPTEGDAHIVGELYEIIRKDEFDWAMAQLDDYEGIAPEEGPALYRRELTTVYMFDQEVKAWIYWYNCSVEGRPLVASGDVLEYLRSRQS